VLHLHVKGNIHGSIQRIFSQIPAINIRVSGIIKAGIMECWNGGLKKSLMLIILALLIIPFFHHSIFPALQFINPGTRRPKKW
jgi:hypothetical protein